MTRSMHSRLRTLALGLAVVQIVDALASATPQMSMAARLDHLGFPHALLPLLPIIKVSTSVGLLVGLRWVPVGTVASAALVAFYSSAIGFHRLAGDHAAAALPAAAVGTLSALSLSSISPTPRRAGSRSWLSADETSSGLPGDSMARSAHSGANSGLSQSDWELVRQEAPRRFEVLVALLYGKRNAQTLSVGNR